MKTTGIVRHVDDLGRLVLPREMRKRLGIENGMSVEITNEGETIVVRRLARPCVFCDTEGAELTEYKGKMVCAACLAELRK